LLAKVLYKNYRLIAAWCGLSLDPRIETLDEFAAE